MVTITNSKLSFTALALASFLVLVHSQDLTSFTYVGSAHVPQGFGFLRLTETDSWGIPVSWNTGRVIHTRPVALWQDSPAMQATFDTTIQFIITPSSKGAADGLAFYIAPPNTTFRETSAGGNLGIFDGPSGTTPSLFAVEFDTYANPWDPNFRHIGIDIESRVSKNTTGFDSATGQLVTARVKYDSNTKTVTVVAFSGTQTASLSYVFDLKTILPPYVEVGISASTGEIASQLGVHDLISWYFTSSLVSDNLNNNTRQYD